MMVLPRRRGGDLAFSPSDLLASGRGTWVSYSTGNVYTDAGKTTLAGNGDIARATVPQAGTLGDFTAASDTVAPLLRVSGGLEYIETDAVDDAISATDGSFVFGPSALYLCGTVNRKTATSGLIFNVNGTGGGNDYVRLLWQTIGRLSFWTRILSQSVALVTANTTATLADNTWAVVELWLDGTNANFALNGGTPQAAAHGFGANTLTLNVFSVSSLTFSSFFTADVFLRDSIPTTEERASLRTFLGANVGLTL